MLDPVRTLLLAAVGAIDLTEDKLRAVVDDLVRRGELAADEARELAARWAAGPADRNADVDERLRLVVEDALGRYNVASHASVAELQTRLTALEEAVARLAAAGAEP